MATRSLARHRIFATLALVTSLGVLVFLPAPAADGAFKAYLVCEPILNGGAFCEAYPDDPTYTYQWSGSGNVYFPDGCLGSFCKVACPYGGIAAGWVRVTVTAPDGSSDTALSGIHCGTYY